MSDTTLVKMSRVESLWERLVNAALRRDGTRESAGGGGGPGHGRDIDAILRAADELQVDDPIIARICKLLCLFSSSSSSVQSCDYFLFFFCCSM